MTPAQQQAASMGTLHLIELLARPRIHALLKSAEANVDLVGRWVWAEFPAIPPARVRKFLRALGFRWNHNRMVWQHSCGMHSTRSNGNPRWTYGSVPIDELQEVSHAV